MGVVACFVDFNSVAYFIFIFGYLHLFIYLLTVCLGVWWLLFVVCCAVILLGVYFCCLDLFACLLFWVICYVVALFWVRGVFDFCWL